MANRSNYLTNAINIKSYSLSESDKILLMYSREKGLLKGVAKGVKNPKSKLGGRMDMLVANKLMLYKGKNLDTICQAEALNTFNNLRTDMDKMLYSAYMAEVVTNFGTEDDPNSADIYDIFYKALTRVSGAASIVEILLAVMRFQLKMMRICGYELQLKNCVQCGCEIATDAKVIFSTEKGGVQCALCTSGPGIHFPAKLRAFLDTLSDTDFDEVTMYDEKANQKVASYCFSLVKSYVSQHCTKKIKSEKLLADLA